MRTTRPRSREALVRALVRALDRAEDPRLSAGARAVNRLRADTLALDVAEAYGILLPVEEVRPATRLRLMLRLEGGG